MSARAILVIHTAVFFLFIIGSATFPSWAAEHPEFVTWKLLAVFAAFGALVPFSWYLAGACPLTVWERRAREREAPGSAYSASCLEYYAERWVGLRVSNAFWTTVVLIFLTVPLATTGLFIFVPA
jgi:hypothetical protein